MKLYKTYRLSSILKLIAFILVLIALFFFSKENLTSAKNTINVFLFSVLPSLFPFILFTEIILKTNVITTLSKMIGILIEKIFRINKNCTQSIIIGFLCGFPMGAKAVIDSYEKNLISKKEAVILLKFVNNCNPIFIISTISLNIFGNIKIGVMLLLSHILSAILLGILSSYKYSNNNIILKNSENLKYLEEKNITNKDFSFFDILKISIKNSFVTLEMILGFMLIFNILSNLCVSTLSNINVPYNILNIITGLFEVTNGCINIGSLTLKLKYKLLLVSFMLGFSGICIIFQIYAVIYKHGFSLKKLCISKFLHGIFSLIITYILIIIFDIDKLDCITSFYSINSFSFNTNLLYNNLGIYYTISLVIIFFILFIIYNIKNKYKKIEK